MPKITLMCGLPGSGKSTVAEDLIKNNKKTIIISRDSIRIMVCSNYANYKFSDVNEGLIKSLTFACLESALERGYNVVIDETNINKVKRKYWIDNIKIIADIKLFDIDISCVWVDTPRKVCVSRRMADPKGTKDNWAMIIGSMNKHWQDPTEDEFRSLTRIEYKAD